MITVLFTPVHFRNIWLLQTQYEVLNKTIPSIFYYPICNNPKEEKVFEDWCDQIGNRFCIVHENPITYEPSLNHTYAMHQGLKALHELWQKGLGSLHMNNLLYMPIDSDIFPCRPITETELENIYRRGYYGHWKENQKHIKYLFIGTSMWADYLIREKGVENINFDLTCIGDSGSYNFLPDRGVFKDPFIDWNQITCYYNCEWRCLKVEGKEFWFQIHDKTWVHLVGGSRQAYGGPPLYIIEKAIQIIKDVIISDPEGAYAKLISITEGKK